MKKFLQSEIILGLILALFISIICVFNYKIAGMAISGVIMNIFGVFVIILYLYINDKRILLFFFFCNILLGPFFIINLTLVGYSNLGRLDIIVALFICTKFILNEKNMRVRNIWMGINISAIIITIIQMFSCKISLNDSVDILSGIWIGYALYKVVQNNLGRGGCWIRWMYYIFLVHVICSILQLFFDIKIRASSIEATLVINGLRINRPVGFFGNSYVYGISTCTLYVILYLCSDTKIKKRLKKIFPIMIFVSIISTRSVILGFIPLTYYLITNKKYKKIFTILLGCLIVIMLFVLMFKYKTILSVIGWSNGIKVTLWGMTIADFSMNSTFFEYLFGHGYKAASNLAINAYSWLNNIGVSIRLGEQINGKDAYPIHNEFLQILYEFGILGFIFYFRMIWVALKEGIGKVDIYIFFVCVAIANYCMHNGFYSQLLIFASLLIIGRKDVSKRYKYLIKQTY